VQIIESEAAESKSQDALCVVYRQLTASTPYSNNARAHTKHQLRQIAESIRLFGFTNPILVNSTDRIIAGHGRMEAAKILGMSQVPTIWLENLNENQIRAYIISDNKLAETQAGRLRSLQSSCSI
jgi:ParB-like chromosome segregation protein Spo0J